MGTSGFTAALIQLDVGPDREENLEKTERLCRQAAMRGADLICLPELFSFMGDFHPPCPAAETVRGPSVATLRRVAREHRVHICGGSILERSGKGLPLNTCCFIGPDGEVKARYSKLHLFDILIPGKIHYAESHAMRPGRHATVVQTPWGVMGVAICNDLRYPELFRRMVAAGAEVIFVPAAFTAFTGRDHWVTLLRARAIENQCFVVAVNQSGKNIHGVRFFGASLVCDPWGRILVEGPPTGDRVLTCDIDLELARRLRKELPALGKIRPRIPLKTFRATNPARGR